ncbi:MAG: DUF1360 domain-containing protein [Minisyncoccota bacterium]
MKYKSMFPWMIIDMAVFVVLNIIMIRFIQPGFVDFLSFITPMQIIILGLAVYRTANIVSNEFITKPVRAYFVQEIERDGKEVEEPYDTGFRGFAGSLLYCPSCTGVWIAAITVYSYILWPGVVSIIALLLALSGVERFFAYTFGWVKRR